MSSPSRGSSAAAARRVHHQLLELARLDQDHLGAGLLGARSSPPRRSRASAKSTLAPGVAQVERDLAPLQQHVHRHDDAARAQDAVVDDPEVRDVREHDPDAVARLDALLLEQAGDPRRALVEHGVVEDGVVELEGRPVGVLRRRLGQQLGKGRHEATLPLMRTAWPPSRRSRPAPPRRGRSRPPCSAGRRGRTRRRRRLQRGQPLRRRHDHAAADDGDDRHRRDADRDERLAPQMPSLAR